MSSSIDTMTLPVEQPPSGKHPKGLYVLFLAEMWERFCYYGMRVLLTLYLIDSLFKKDTAAFAIYGAYTALVYAAPVLGGKIADKILGYRIAVILGGVLMAIGEFMILGGTEHWLYIGMGIIIVGNGYFKANISSIVGKLYADGDTRRDSGFTIFYIGINIGALLATTVVAEVGRKIGYEYGFALAGLGMLLGMVFFIGGQKTFRHVAEAPNPEKLNAPYLGPISLKWTTILASLLVIPVLYFLLVNASVVGYLLYAAFGYVLWSLLSRGLKEGKVLLERMIVFIILMVFNVVFWACFEQAGTSLTLFARRNVDRMVGGWEMSDATTQFFNPLFIIVMGSVFSMLWVYLNRIGKNPNIPMKFGFGIILLGLGYLVIQVAPLSEAYLTPLWILALLYFLHTTGELFISPIGLSMVTKLVPKDMTGTAMGAWFLSFAGSNYLAAILASLTGVSGHGGTDGPEKVVPDSFQQTIELITLQEDRYINALTTLNVSSEQLAASAEHIESPGADLERLSVEVKEMSTGIQHTVSQLNEQAMFVLKDTTRHNPISWNVMVFLSYSKPFNRFAVEYYDAIESSVAGIELLAKGMQQLGTGAIGFDAARELMSGGVTTYESGVEEATKLFTKFHRANTSFELEAVKEVETQAYALIRPPAAHLSWGIYKEVFVTMGLVTVCIGLLLMLISGPLNRMMHGVR